MPPQAGTAPRAEGTPDRRSSLRSAHGLAHHRRFSLSSSRAGTMSTETASGPTEDQVEILEYNFNKVNKHPDPTTLCLIAAEAGLSEEETQVSPGERPARPRSRPPRQPRSREGEGLPRPRLPPGLLLPDLSAFLPAPREPRPASLPPQHPCFSAPPAPGLPCTPAEWLPQKLLRNPTHALPSDFPLSPAARESTLSSRRAGSRVNEPTFVLLSQV